MKRLLHSFFILCLLVASLSFALADPPQAVAKETDFAVFNAGITEEAADLVVDQSGANGAYATIQAALDNVNSGQTILIKAGTYAETATLKRSGMENEPITIRGEKNEAGEKLAVLNGTISLNKASYVRISDFKMDGAKTDGTFYGPAVKIENLSHYVHVTDLDIRNYSGAGIYYHSNSENGYASGNYMYSVAQGFQVSANSIIENNEIEFLNLNGNTAAAGDYFRVFGSNVIIRNNYTHGSYKGSHMGAAHVDIIQSWDDVKIEIKNILIENNVFLDWVHQGLMLENDAFGSQGIYYLSDWTIRNNVFAGYEAWAICGGKANGGIPNMVVENNVFAGNSQNGALYGAMLVGSGSTGTIRNNVFLNHSVATTGALNGAEADSDYNLFWNTVPPSRPGVNDIFGSDPRFADPDNYDFRLQADSPAINMGQTRPGFDKDLEGNSRPADGAWDIGPYEFQNSPAFDSPLITIVSPSFAQLFKVGDEVKAEVNARTAIGSVSSVEYFLDGQSVAVSTQAPFDLNLGTFPEGGYAVTAVVTNSLGKTTTSNEVLFWVTNQEAQLADTTYVNIPFDPQTGTFTVGFRVTPLTDNMNGVAAIAKNDIGTYSQMAAAVQMNPDGYFYARNGGAYIAPNLIPYQKYHSYFITITANVVSRKYDVYIKPDGGRRQKLATGLDFRTEQAYVDVINRVAATAETGSLLISDVELNPLILPDEDLVVDQTGSHGALTTIQAALDMVQPGQTILIKSGTYTEDILFTRSGTESQPIIIRGEESGRITLKGSFQILAAHVYLEGLNLEFLGTESTGLTGLALSGSPAGYIFAQDKYSYTGVTVTNSVYSITVIPTGPGTITVDDVEVPSGNPSAAIDLTPGVERTIKVVAGEAGRSLKTYTIQVTREVLNPPGAPLVIQAATPGDRTVTLNWKGINEGAIYHLYQSTVSGSYGHALASVTGSVYDAVYNPQYSYHATGLTNGTTYYFTVQAVDSEGNSFYSAEASATPAAAPGAPTDVAAVAGNGQAIVSFTAPASNGGSTITEYIVTSNPGGVTAHGTASPIVISGLTNGTSYTFTVTAVNGVGNSAASSASAGVTPFAPSNGSSYLPPAYTDVHDADAVVMLNGKAEKMGTITSVKEGEKTITRFAIDEKLLEQMLAKAGDSPVITIPVDVQTDAVISELNGQIIRSMLNKQAVIEIRTKNASYTLPAKEIDIETMSRKFGKNIRLQDIQVRIEISRAADEMVSITENAAERQGFTLITLPLDFRIQGVHEGKTTEISRFSTYVSRTIDIPEDVFPAGITGITVELDGTVRPVPTSVVQTEGKYFARISSLTNSSYSLVRHQMKFKDAERHWARDAIEDMSSRMVINGIEEGLFEPERNITRGEWAAVLTRGLGLKPEAGTAAFEDAGSSAWYNNYIAAVMYYNLMEGYEEGAFKPMDKLTREQAMATIARAMKITGLETVLAAGEADMLLADFADAEETAIRAREDIASCIKAGLVSGQSDTLLAPKAEITRAEAVVLIRLLLQKSNLIN